MSHSRLLSYVLRHRPDELGLVLGEGGWVAVDELLAALARHGTPITRAELELLVATNEKRRFALSEDGARIRANQGHSVSVDLGHAPADPPAILYHGTVQRFLASIREQGLVRGQRHHVHLSSGREAARVVGGRRGTAIVLEVRAGDMAKDGHVFYRTPNDVWLTEQVPAEYLVFPEADPDSAGSRRKPRPR